MNIPGKETATDALHYRAYHGFDPPRGWYSDDMATTKTTTSQYARAGQYAPGIGDNLDKLANRDVLLVHYSLDERPLSQRKDSETNDDPAPAPTGRKTTDLATIVFLTIAEDVSKPEETTLFHAWSDSLAQKIAQIPTDKLPLLIMFSKVRTGGGFNVWTFE